MTDALECAGLVVHEGKSVCLPSISTAWLGFVADLERGCVSVPEAKLEALRAMLQITGVATHLNARFIASLVGKIISMGLALGPMSRIMTRSLYMYILLWSRHAWCEHLEINRGVQRELELWRSSSCVAQYNAHLYGLTLQPLGWCIQGGIQWRMACMLHRVVGCQEKQPRVLREVKWWWCLGYWTPLHTSCVI